jgi:putative ABC transport system permease protein
MFRNYVVTALRNMERNWLYASISILGLVVAFTAAILVVEFVRNEFSYDRWLPGYQRVYLITHVIKEPDQPPSPSDLSPSAIAGQLRTRFTGATAIARLFVDRPVVRRRAGDAPAFESAFAWADPDFFKVLPLPAIAGDPSKALQQPGAVAITRRMARKYFNRDQPIGDIMDVQIGNTHHALRVVAILKDLPSNTVLISEVFSSSRAAYSRSAPLDAQPQLGLYSCQTFVRLAAKGAAADLQNALDIAGRPEVAQSAAYGAKLAFSMVPLKALHLHAPEAATSSAAKPTGDAAAAYATGVVGALIVVVAAINFISLMTARSARRAVEVGVRKAMGAGRADLMAQFVGEALIQVAFAVLIAMALAELLTPAFGGFVHRDLTLNFLHDPKLLGCVLGAALSVGGLSAIYPALVLSSFRPGLVLKGGVVQTPGSTLARQTLVAVQFAILIGLIATTATLYRQTQFALRQGLGGEASNRMVQIRTPCDNAFAEEVRRLAGVASAACASLNATTPLTWKQTWLVRSIDGRPLNLFVAQVDFGFLDEFDIHPSAGRLFDRSHGRDNIPVTKGSDTVYPSVILNESAARYLGYASPGKAVGQAMLWSDPAVLAATGGTDPISPIIGVIPDMPATVREAATPTFYIINPKKSGMLVAKLNGQDMPTVLGAIERTWKATGNVQPFSAVFLAQSRQAQYFDIITQSIIIGSSAAVAVLIACLGLLALSAFAAERRTREIGVRKVMGAATRDVMMLLLWQFTIPVLAAAVVAVPVASLVIGWWLHGFVYHVHLSAWTFVAAAGAAVAIAWLTVSYQSFTVARARPAQALRYE